MKNAARNTAASRTLQAASKYSWKPKAESKYSWQ